MYKSWYKFVVSLLVVLSLLVFSNIVFAQGRNLTTPQASPHASVSQTIGLTEITIDYHRPGVKGRKIWGGLVPYGMAPGAAFNFKNEFPWRAGANENTTISFSTDVTVEGTKIPAGKYGLHMIPSENDWTLVLSKDNAAWGSFFYDEKNDQARITVTPTSSDEHEWLKYDFENLSPNSTVANLYWEKLKVPFKIEVDLNKTVLANMRTELTNLAGFNWQAWMQAAQFCLRNNMNHDEALTWIDNSISRNKNVRNVGVKAMLLEKSGQTAKAKAAISETMTLADQSDVETDLNNLGYLFLFNGKTDEAIKVFKLNVKKHPDAWNTYDSLADAFQKKGKVADSVKNYKIALQKAPAAQKGRIEGVLNSMQN